jgi:XRN 5'-3' exonuclease N-terminus
MLYNKIWILNSLLILTTNVIVEGFVTVRPSQTSNGLGPHFDSHLVSSSRSTTTQLYGIPKMFRWLTDQYPNINRRLSEGLTSDLQVDNFYLDMNGIIHPCTHGNAEGKIIVLDETAMFKKIFLYVDRYVMLCYDRLLR